MLWDASRTVLELLTPYIADLIPDSDGGPDLDLILKDYLPRMARIRADPKVVAEVLAKFNLQRIYTNELRSLLEATDQILGLSDDMPRGAPGSDIEQGVAAERVGCSVWEHSPGGSRSRPA